LLGFELKKPGMPKPIAKKVSTAPAALAIAVARLTRRRSPTTSSRGSSAVAATL
jgi:hypothetical protein